MTKEISSGKATEMASQTIDEHIGQLNEGNRAAFMRWARTTNSLHFLRTTAARIGLAVFSLGVLFWGGYFAWAYAGAPMWIYVVALVVVGILQRISIRFALSDDQPIDEYQQLRRNSAYRRAYRRLALVIGLIAVLALAAGEGQWNIANQAMWPIPYGHISFSMSNERFVVAMIFFVGLVDLLKHLSWGLRGEQMARD